MCYCGSVLWCSRLRFTNFRVLNLSEGGALKLKGLEQVDEELKKGNEREALAFVKDLQGKNKPLGLRCFGAARQKTRDLDDVAQVYSSVASAILFSLISWCGGALIKVPQRLYSLDELKLNGIEASSLLSPEDTTLGAIERNLQLAALLGAISLWNVFGFDPQAALYLSLGVLFLWTLDLVSFNGGISSLALDTIGHTFSSKYHNRVIQHEAGHFLIAYLLGILPKGYTLSSLEAFQKEGSLNVQAGTSFVDFEFLEEVNSGKVSATMLNRFSCIALAGVATEYLLYGYSEGGVTDINQLDGLLKSLGFTQKKANSQVRWAVLNTVLILRRHEQARAKLAEAMANRKSVGFCIDTIEKTIGDDDI